MSCCNKATQKKSTALPQETQKKPNLGNQTESKRILLSQASWQIQGMDCPACAAKLERALLRLEGVIKVSISFSMARLKVDFNPNLCSHSLLLKAATNVNLNLLPLNAGKEQEPSSWFSRLQFSWYFMSFVALIGLAIGIGLIAPSLGFWAFTAASLWGLYPIAKKSLKGMTSGTPFSIETLMSIATLGAIALGDVNEAVVILFLFTLGERLEAYASGKARQGVKNLMQLLPETAVKIVDNQSIETPICELIPGDTVSALPGDRIPADGVLLSDSVYLDESPLTGESIPVEHLKGDRLMAGTLITDQPIRIKITSQAGQSAVDRILHLIESSEANKAPIERFIDRFSRWYTPSMIFMAAMIAAFPPLFFSASWSEWIYKGLTLLLIACPCALVISTPAAITSALARSAKYGLLIKGGAAIEQIAKIKTIAFDKTGTLTQGRPIVTEVVSLAESFNSEQILSVAAALEIQSKHPLAKAVIRASEKKQLILPEVKNSTTLAGIGITGRIGEESYSIYSPKHYFNQVGSNTFLKARFEQHQKLGQTVVVISKSSEAIGFLAIEDELRSDSIETIQGLKKLGIHSLMLTGDNQTTAKNLANKLAMDYQAELLPEDKLKAINASVVPIAMVGDGINDAPALKAASVGISMGSASDVALEVADCAISHNRLSELPRLIKLARATKANIEQNISVALGLKLIFLITTLTGLTGLWLAILADSGATALVTANALRLLKK